MNRVHPLEKLSIKSIVYLYIIWTAFRIASPVQGQIIPDNTLGTEASGLNQNQIINGKVADGIEGGARRDSNLFHSFSEFNINQGQRVYFANPTGVENILTRVTGGKASNIFGTLGVDGAANLFLINPAGIVFGQNAKLDLQGSFVGTTANGVQFGNQELFSATNPQTPSLLTVGVPVGLQYGSNPGAIQVQGAILQVQGGQSLTLAGGAVNIDGGRLLAPGGRVELGGVSAAGTIGLNGDGSLSFPNNLARADISMFNAAKVDVRVGGGGSITVNARNFEVTQGSQLFTGIPKGLDRPEFQAGDITIDATDAIKFDGESKDGEPSGAFSQVNLHGAGKGGSILITTGSLEVLNGARLDATTFSKGDAGSVTITAKDAIKFDGEGTFSSGAFSRVIPGAVGKGGSVSISTGSLAVTNGARLEVSTYGKGDAGSVTITAKDTIKFDGESKDGDASGAFSGITKYSQTGYKGGSISITTNSLEVLNGARLDASTNGKGDAGSVTITAKDTTKFDGESNKGQGSGASSQTNSGNVGNAGSISITTGSLEVLNGAGLDSGTYGKGDAGSITIIATDVIKFDGEGKFPSGASSRVDLKATGKGGNVSITTNSLVVTNGAQLSASTKGNGDAGNITLKVKDNIIVSGSNTRISANTIEDSASKGGNITTDSKTLILRDGATISAYSQGKGSGGNIKLIAGSLILDRGTISTATSSNTGGNITLNLADLLLLRNGSKISTNAETASAGGNITINGKFIVAFPNENSDISADAFNGKGGTIKINLQKGGIFGIKSRTELTGQSDITAIGKSPELNGTVELNTPDNSSIQNSFTQISPNVIDTNALIANSCISRGNQRQENSFTITGSGALRNSPGDALMSDYSTGEVRNIEPTSRPWKKGDPIIEAQGLYRLPDGQLILSRTCD
ncbi:MAG: filamentous hemagglutinin N-terminal domain-containing protein [Nostoc sp. ChiSLP02]|nr:filamentous hemagglutinin N-terminal domain-containing protein [Nostoc sp. ChiSLP02]